MAATGKAAQFFLKKTELFDDWPGTQKTETAEKDLAKHPYTLGRSPVSARNGRRFTLWMVVCMNLDAK
jgi:hypothetical protein